MKNRRLWLMLTLLLCAVTMVAAALPSTVAYIADRANTVRNTFRVEYLPPQDITVPVRVHKTVMCLGEEEIGPEGFSFRMENTQTGRAVALTAGADGYAQAELTFTAEDVGKTYNYRLYELNAGREYVTYDETVYEISISLQLDEQHEMEAVITMDGEAVSEIAAEFVNLYQMMEIPDTGDHDQPLAWLAMLLVSSIGLALLYMRKAIGRRA